MSNQAPIINIMESKLQITALAGCDNWKIWKVWVKDWLAEKEMSDIITTTRPVQSSTTPVITADNVAAWNKQNIKALAAIQCNCTDDVMSHIEDMDTARGAWERLTQLYEQSDF